MIRVHQRRLLELWSWLPAFRFVAETEHLPTAARLLHTSPSNLSRSIRLLERQLGRKLFDRVGRNLVLNAAGRELLAATRAAMRGVDGALERLESDALRGTLQIWSTTQVGTTWLVRASARLRERHPALTLSLRAPGHGDLARALLRGETDLVLAEHPPTDPELRIDRVGTVTNAVYCGHSHPLAQAPAPTATEVLAHPFVAPPDVPGPAIDGWPADQPRRVALQVDQLRVALQACLEGGLLAVLPDPIVADDVRAGRLRRLEAIAIPPNAVYAVRRVPVGGTDAAGEVVEALRAAADASGVHSGSVSPIP